MTDELHPSLAERQLRSRNEIGIKVMPPLGPRRPVSQNRFAGVIGIVPWKLDVRDPATLAAGVLARLGRHLPVPDLHFFGELREFAYHRFKSRYKPLDVDVDLTPETYLPQTNYSAKRIQSLIAKWNDMPFDDVTPEFFADLMRCGIFGKDEFYLEPKFVRLIAARHDLLLLFLGPAVKAVEKEIFKSPHFIKKIPTHERPEYIERQLAEGEVPAVFEGDDGLGKHNGKIVGTDWTSFEVVFRQSIAVLGSDLMTYMLSNFLVELRRLNTACWTGSWGRAKLMLVCFVMLIRNSGDLITSLINGYSNAIIWEFLHVKFPDRDLTTEDFARLGGICKIDISETVGEASFCGMMYDEGGKQMIRDAAPVIAKIGWCPLRYVGTSDVVHLQLLKLRLLSLGHEMGKCPILWAYARQGLYKLRNVRIRQSILDGLDVYEKERVHAALDAYGKSSVGIDGFMPEIMSEPTQATRELYSHCFGVDVPTQLSLEASFASMDYRIPNHFPGLEFPDLWSDIYDEYVSDCPSPCDYWMPFRPELATQKLDLSAPSPKIRTSEWITQT